MKTFSEFVDKKSRRARKHLGLIEKALAGGGMNIRNHLEDEDEPFIFMVSPNNKVSFGGVRIYQTGETMAYRIQKEEKTHPYGRAYRLDIEEMYEDLLSDDDMNEKKAAKQVVEAIIKQLDKFFEKSQEAEKDMRGSEFDQQGDPLGRVMMRSTGTDYSNSVKNK